MYRIFCVGIVMSVTRYWNIISQDQTVRRNKKYLHQKRALKIVQNFNLRSLTFLNPKIQCRHRKYLYLTVTVHRYHISEVQITNAMDSFSTEIGTHIPCTTKVGGLWCV